MAMAAMSLMFRFPKVENYGRGGEVQRPTKGGGEGFFILLLATSDSDARGVKNGSFWGTGRVHLGGDGALSPFHCI